MSGLPVHCVRFRVEQASSMTKYLISEALFTAAKAETGSTSNGKKSFCTWSKPWKNREKCGNKNVDPHGINWFLFLLVSVCSDATTYQSHWKQNSIYCSAQCAIFPITWQAWKKFEQQFGWDEMKGDWFESCKRKRICYGIFLLNQQSFQLSWRLPGAHFNIINKRLK